ncbi:uncharacterized protein VTP21DRAFT_2504 [Calcarisporiella thermophila]|uniref:uncharacterized protein n=1 Tax=Calcarisporiella thermophila TaxID=911321 RepID=UPI003744AC86
MSYGGSPPFYHRSPPWQSSAADIDRTPQQSQPASQPPQQRPPYAQFGSHYPQYPPPPPSPFQHPHPHPHPHQQLPPIQAPSQPPPHYQHHDLSPWGSSPVRPSHPPASGYGAGWERKGPGLDYLASPAQVNVEARMQDQRFPPSSPSSFEPTRSRPAPFSYHVGTHPPAGAVGDSRPPPLDSTGAAWAKDSPHRPAAPLPSPVGASDYHRPPPPALSPGMDYHHRAYPPTYAHHPPPPPSHSPQHPPEAGSSMSISTLLSEQQESYPPAAVAHHHPHAHHPHAPKPSHPHQHPHQPQPQPPLTPHTPHQHRSQLHHPPQKPVQIVYSEHAERILDDPAPHLANGGKSSVGGERERARHLDRPESEGQHRGEFQIRNLLNNASDDEGQKAAQSQKTGPVKQEEAPAPDLSEESGGHAAALEQTTPKRGRRRRRRGSGQGSPHHHPAPRFVERWSSGWRPRFAEGADGEEGEGPVPVGGSPPPPHAPDSTPHSAMAASSTPAASAAVADPHPSAASGGKTLLFHAVEMPGVTRGRGRGRGRRGSRARGMTRASALRAAAAQSRVSAAARRKEEASSVKTEPPGEESDSSFDGDGATSNQREALAPSTTAAVATTTSLSGGDKVGSEAASRLEATVPSISDEDSGDEDMLDAYDKEALFRYMMSLYKRRRRVIEAYERRSKEKSLRRQQKYLSRLTENGRLGRDRRMLSDSEEELGEDQRVAKANGSLPEDGWWLRKMGSGAYRGRKVVKRRRRSLQGEEVALEEGESDTFGEGGEDEEDEEAREEEDGKRHRKRHHLFHRRHLHGQRHYRASSAAATDDDALGAETEDLSTTEAAPSPSPVSLSAIDVYEARRRKVWLTLARKEIPKAYRLVNQSTIVRQANNRKVAQQCAREARRAVLRSARSVKDLQARCKRAMKEMLSFWKKNEKEERELRKRAEREALERLRIEEERREARRQQRKLNFLITQTEIYSHFIGRKIKTDAIEATSHEIESPTPSSAAATPMDASAKDDKLDNDLMLSTEEPTQLEDIDFDADDDEKIRQHARQSAHHALMAQAERTRIFDEGARERRTAANRAGDANGKDIGVTQEAFDNMDFMDPSTMRTTEIHQPKMLMCQLKNYQLKGLNWLANLYEQGINGILADEMGLGKTVQSIALLSYLAETQNIWGPFLVIAPASTLHNWQQEFSKFVPAFRALPYWGSVKDRKTLRKFWHKNQMYGRDAPFHVLITSYQLVVVDEKYFQRVKWQYMILDEAQAIKSSSSVRWKTLLGFNCRNRLLLTGTPIQNSMQELWALLHFIMPTLFDSHEEFSEWFSKDIESHAENKSSLNEHQLKRLHMILKPFMLRRIKRNVQHELGEKIELDIECQLTARQRQLYKGLMEKISISELLEKATSLNEAESLDSLMNLVMQFRKVCNHPELFERADVESPFVMGRFALTPSIAREGDLLQMAFTTRSLITYHIPKKLYREGGILRVPGHQSAAGLRGKYLDRLMNIWSVENVHRSMLGLDDEGPAKDGVTRGGTFSFVRFCDMDAMDASRIFFGGVLLRWLNHLLRRKLRARRRMHSSDPAAPINTFALFLIAETCSPLPPAYVSSASKLLPLTEVAEVVCAESLLRNVDGCFMPPALSPPVGAVCSDHGFHADLERELFDPLTRGLLLGNTDRMMTGREQALVGAAVHELDDRGMLERPWHGFTYILVPPMQKLIMDSGKLARLDRLLEQLKSEGHRVLIYFQMTRMIDLMEEYLIYRQYKYLRLDGSSKISDRRDMVTDWQTRPEIFIFLLSTRAGGLGINLTAADTVIFYDSDWNPTVDQQAMDRAHRLGQTKQVTVYRLITKGTIEERIRQRAKQKDEIQKVVISGGEFKQQVDFKPREIVSLLLDDNELEMKLAEQQTRRRQEEETKPKRGGRGGGGAGGGGGGGRGRSGRGSAAGSRRTSHEGTPEASSSSAGGANGSGGGRRGRRSGTSTPRGGASTPRGRGRGRGRGASSSRGLLGSSVAQQPFGGASPVTPSPLSTVQPLASELEGTEESPKAANGEDNIEIV